MKNFLNFKSLQLLGEQALFSIFNFLIVIFLYHGYTYSQVGSIGVNITALYGLVSISRNLISGDFTQDEFSTTEIKLEDVLAIVLIRSLKIAPVTSFGLLFSCLLTKTDLSSSFLFLIISIQVTIVDNFRQVEILFSKMNFMSVNLILSVLFSTILFLLIGPDDNRALKFWIVTFFFYIMINLIRVSKISTQIFKVNSRWDSSISRKDITLESFFNHSMFFIFNYLFFYFDPTLSGKVRLITAWIVNSASSLYITLGNFYNIKMVNGHSTKSEQRGINTLALTSLSLCAIAFSVISSFLPFNNFFLNGWILFGTCISSLSFFIHSRISVLYLHSNFSNNFLIARITTWFLTLSLQLFPTILFADFGFFVGSIASFFFVTFCYESALSRTDIFS